MWFFEVRIHRSLHPQEGQQYLETINRQVSLNTYNTGFQPIKIPGISVYGNPFPDWLQRTFSSAGLKYRDINHTYSAFFESREDAEAWERWVVGGELHGQQVHGIKQYFPDQAVWESLATRVAECDPATAGMLDDF